MTITIILILIMGVSCEMNILNKTLKLVWHDEFDNSYLNNSNWQISKPYCQSKLNEIVLNFLIILNFKLISRSKCYELLLA